MRVIPVDQPPGGRATATKRGSFWQKLAQSLDAYVVNRTKRAESEATLRRSRHDIARFRRLMHQSSAGRVEARLGSRRLTQSGARS
jgi:hypothetical protein